MIDLSYSRMFTSLKGEELIIMDYRDILAIEENLEKESKTFTFSTIYLRGNIGYNMEVKETLVQIIGIIKNQSVVDSITETKDEPIMPAPKPTKTIAALWAESLDDFALKTAICSGGCSNCPVANNHGAFFCTDLKEIHNYMHKEVEI